MSRYRVSVRFNKVGSGGGTTRSVDVDASSESSAETEAIRRVKQSFGSQASDYQFNIVKTVKIG